MMSAYAFFSLAVAVSAVSAVATASSGYSWMTLGDWGGASISAQDKQNVYAVAGAMANSAAAIDPSFIVNTGDNFYWCGIMNSTDSQIHTDFELPYADPSLVNLQWFSILGNHEYGYNVQAELDYAMINDRWVMPARYYTRREKITGTSPEQYISFIFLDTSPCVLGYRESNPANWDPCSTQYPTCSPGATDDDFEGECNFHANILTQSCDDQYAWFLKELAAVPADDWLVVVGHHPIDEVNVFDYTAALQKRGFSIYLNGHAHTLTQYTIDGGGAYVTSGAGSLVDTPDQQHEHIAAKVRGESEPVLDGRSTLADTDNSAMGARRNNHTYQTVFNMKVAGFTTHTFNADASVLTTAFVSYTGEEVHSFQSYKDGSLVTAVV